MRRKAPAVISVFAALVWCLVASLLFVLLDGVRITAMSDLLEDRVHLACRNVMANYQKELYEEYGILGIDEIYSRFEEGTGDIVETMLTEELEYEKEWEQKNHTDHSVLSARVNLLNYPAIEMEDGGYQLLSDGKGKVFLRQTAAYMTSLLPESAAEKLLGEYTDQDVFRQEKDMEKIYAEALEALQTASQIKSQSQEGDSCTGELEDNPVTSVGRQRNGSILDLVLPDQIISSAYMDTGTSPSKRTLQKGTITTGSITPQEKVLGVSYCSRIFSDYQKEKKLQKNKAVIGEQTLEELRYQMEYLVAGKDSDRENLSAVCKKLLVIRETVQFALYCADPQQRAKASAESLALVGFTGNPVLIKAVQYGFLACWSFEEAVNDVKKLMEGKEISLLGTASSPMYSYEDYLKLLLFFQPAEQMAMRSLDVIENHINARTQRGTFYVDRTITAIQGKARAKIPWLFTNLVTVPLDSRTVYSKVVSWREDYY